MRLVNDEFIPHRNTRGCQPSQKSRNATQNLTVDTSARAATMCAQQCGNMARYINSTVLRLTLPPTPGFDRVEMFGFDCEYGRRGTQDSY